MALVASPSSDEAVEIFRLLHAAMYLRVSSETQTCSLAVQAQALRDYADAHAIDIVRTYADEGISGLTLAGRPALKRLIEDVQATDCPFNVLLTYDVSRWGRFQNKDEPAYYEYLCRRAGVEVVYCAEPFLNDRSPLSAIIKGLKRVMAAEYSRELSAKVLAAQRRLAALGYHQGGVAPYGLRRVVVDGSGTVRGALLRDQYKRNRGDRVRVVPGPRAETAIVRRIFREFVHLGRSETQIAAGLSEQRSTLLDGQPWPSHRVRDILQNEIYTGTIVFARYATTLRTKGRHRPPEEWVRYPHAFPPIVPEALYQAATDLYSRRRGSYRNATMLGLLRDLQEAHGTVTGRMVDAAKGMPTRKTYEQRFGGFRRACELAGVGPPRDNRYARLKVSLKATLSRFFEDTIAAIARDGSSAARSVRHEDVLMVAGKWSAIVKCLPCRPNHEGQRRWHFSRPRHRIADFLLILRFDEAGAVPIDGYLFPMVSLGQRLVTLGPVNNGATERYHVGAIREIGPLAGCTLAYPDELTAQVGGDVRRGH
jgi:DNA invertase Pin-like site-specific DNA recombinase